MKNLIRKSRKLQSCKIFYKINLILINPLFSAYFITFFA